MTQLVNRPVCTQSQVALHLMVNQLTISTMPAASRHQNMIVNDIPAELYVNADQHKLASLIGGVLNTMISHSRNSAIRVSAKFFGNVMLIHLKGDSYLNNETFAGCLKEVHRIAGTAGATVGITSHRNEITTVALSFVNAQRAA